MRTDLIASLALLGTCLAACAPSPQVADTAVGAEASTDVETLSEFPIPVQRVVIRAPVREVWDAFTTTEGYSAWAAPFAVVDLRVNGTIEASYADGASAGDPANIVLSIPAYLPERMLVLKTIQAPPGFASDETLERLVSIIEFEALGPDATRVTLSGVGYTEDDDEMRTGFLRANAWTLGQLRTYLEGETPEE